MTFAAALLCTLAAAGPARADLAPRPLASPAPHRLERPTPEPSLMEAPFGMGAPFKFDFDFDLDLELDAAGFGPDALALQRELSLGPLALLDRHDNVDDDDSEGDAESERERRRDRKGRGQERRADRNDGDEDRRAERNERDEDRRADRNERDEDRRGDGEDAARQHRAARDELQRLREAGRAEREARRKGRRGGSPSAEASGESTARLAVAGPITFQLRSSAGDLIVVAGQKNEVRMTLTDAPRGEVSLLLFGDRVEPGFGGKSALRRGKLRVEVPPGSKVDFQSMSGDVEVQGTAGDVRIRTMSGDVKVKGCGAADVQSISGDVLVEGAGGPVRLQTVSGNGVVSTDGAAPQLSFSSASGNLDWSGSCGKGCRLSTETVSGDVKLKLGKSSSFGLSFVSHTGEVDRGNFEPEIEEKRGLKKRHGMNRGIYEATFGRGEGVIESDAFSGGLRLEKR